MDLHPYDGATRRFRDDDPGDRSAAVSIVAQLLGAAPPSGSPLRYDMSFYSGGLGACDSFAISVEAPVAFARDAARRLGFAPAADAVTDTDMRELIDSSPDALDVPSLAWFVDEHRAAFQPSLAADAEAWFEPDCSSNHWTVIYAQGGWVHLCGFDCG